MPGPVLHGGLLLQFSKVRFTVVARRGLIVTKTVVADSCIVVLEGGHT